MSTEPEHTLTRRRLLRNGAAGSVMLAGPLLATAPARAAAAQIAHAASAPKKGGTLIFARSVAPTQLDPANSIIAGDVYTLDKIFEPLFVTSPAGQADALARAELHDKRGRPDLDVQPASRASSFSNGTPLTPADVVFSIKREAATTRTGRSASSTSRSRRSRRSGTNKVVFTLSAPWAPFLSDISVFANAIMPANFGGKSEKAFFAKPIGTGPFMLDSFTPSSNLTLKRNPHYWQAGKPYVDAVQINYVSDDNQRVLQVQSGQAHIIDSVPPANVASLKKASGVSVGLFPAWEVDLLVFNEKLPQFADRHVRRAITYAINRPALVAGDELRHRQAGRVVLPAEPPVLRPSTPPCSRSALRAAKAELAKSKYPHGFATKLLISGGVQKCVGVRGRSSSSRWRR